MLLQRHRGGEGDATQLSDEMLVLACQRGDEMAWEQLVVRYKRLVYAVPRRAGLDEDLAAEVFQRVFVTLLESIDRIKQPARISAWLVTTARRETWRTGRRERAASKTIPLDVDDEDEDEQNDIPDDALPLDEMLLRLEEAQLIRAAIDSLNERCRGLLTLLFYHPDSPPYTEIAATLGIKAGSIGQTRTRCLQKLLSVLDEMGWE
jgi:RNA polymerase sigma factor (sigma-70 family)